MHCKTLGEKNPEDALNFPLSSSGKCKCNSALATQENIASEYIDKVKFKLKGRWWRKVIRTDSLRVLELDIPDTLCWLRFLYLELYPTPSPWPQNKAWPKIDGHTEQPTSPFLKTGLKEIYSVNYLIKCWQPQSFFKMSILMVFEQKMI